MGRVIGTAIHLWVVIFVISAGAEPQETFEDVWARQTDRIGAIAESIAGQAIPSDDPASREELIDFLYSNIAMAYFGIVHGDSEYPDFWPGLNQVFRAGWPNPDDAYYFVPVHDQGVYRISGYRGTVKILDFQVTGGDAGRDGSGAWGPALVNYDADQLRIDDNGWFEVILSAERPEGYQGNWWKLHEGAAWIMARQRSYDWLKEVDGRFGIERLDKPARQPKRSAAELALKLDGIALWAENWIKLSLVYARSLYQNAQVNSFSLIDFGEDGGFTATVQRYPQTVFKLRDDEALIVETELPEDCRYWNFQLVDTYWRTMGGHSQFNSINAHQGRIDGDGRFRFVVSARDPGVPNWLDSMGHETGFVYGRWNLCSSTPLPKTLVVKVDQVRDFLPADTPEVSPQARDEALRERRLGAQMRRRW